MTQRRRLAQLCLLCCALACARSAVAQNGGRWSVKAPMPTARGALAVGIVGGKIYAVGGVGTNGRNTAANEEFDPARNLWSKHAPIPSPRDHHAIGVVAGKLYAIGGRRDGRHAQNVDPNEEYDPATDKWRSRAPLPTLRSGAAGAVLGGRIFVFGG